LTRHSRNRLVEEVRKGPERKKVLVGLQTHPSLGKPLGLKLLEPPIWLILRYIDNSLVGADPEMHT
jgi:hypothetical protein